MCMCDKNEGYLCFYCETFLNQEVKELAQKYKSEIIRDGDWWHGLTDWSINIFADEDTPGLYQVNAYRVGENGMDDYSADYLLEPIKFNVNTYQVLMTTADYVTVTATNAEEAQAIASSMYASGEIRPEHPEFLCEEEADRL